MMDEYVFSHRAVRQLATLAARSGLPTLRFDYYGTGDSGGESSEVSVVQCEDDARTAIAELKDVSGVPKVAVVGLRFGASVAVSVSRGRFDVSRVVLWDPIVRGRLYLQELADRHRAIMNTTQDPETRIDHQEEGLCGFPISERLRDEIESIDLTAKAANPEKGVLVAVCESNASYVELRMSYERRKLDCDWQLVAGQRIWEERSLAANELVPRETLHGIVAWLG